MARPHCAPPPDIGPMAPTLISQGSAAAAGCRMAIAIVAADSSARVYFMVELSQCARFLRVLWRQASGVRNTVKGAAVRDGDRFQDGVAAGTAVIQDRHQRRGADHDRRADL